VKVKDVMVKNVVKIKSDVSILEAIKKMHHKGTTSLFVKEKGAKEYGIVTRKDIIHQVIAHNKDPKRIRVSDIMSMPLIAISRDLTIENVAMLMAKTNIRRFPVMNGDKLVGLISNSDILRASISKLK